MIRAMVLLIACALSAINAVAQAASSTTLTIRVFSERRVDAITITPISSRRMDAHLPAVPASANLRAALSAVRAWAHSTDTCNNCKRSRSSAALFA